MNKLFFICFLVHSINAKLEQECSKTICYPTAGDLLIGRESMLRASSTCGLGRSEKYCVVTLTDRGRDSKCSTCDSRHPYNKFSSPDSHRIGNVVSRLPQDSNRWWQSNNGLHKVSIEVEFVTEFQFIFTQLRFKTYRPAAMYIERSKDYGLSWQQSAYFSDNCRQYFPHIPQRKRNKIDEVTCTSEFSSISPSEGGTVLFVATPSDLHTNDDDWLERKNDITAITNLRVQFVKLHTFGDVKIDNNPSILNKYHYAVSEWIIRGRCSCYGHAARCKPKRGEIELKEKVYGVCVCQHNTIGPNCEKCKDFYNDTPWKPAENNATNECKKCNCNNHSTTCHFNSVLYDLSGRTSGGNCDTCMHNTEGVNCQRCASGYYRNPDVNITSPDTCLKCKCDGHGSKVPGLCHQENEPDQGIVAGSCSCKQNVVGYYCNRCKIGYWNFDKNDEKGCTECNCVMNGTVNNEGCDQNSGTCLCKRFVEGKSCNVCKNGYYNISASNPLGCSRCRCSNRGSLDYGKCDRFSGQCNCKEGYTGTMCDQIKDGFYIISPKYGLNSNGQLQIDLPPVSESGLYNFIITFDTQQVKIRDTYVALLTIDHQIKTACVGSEDTIYINKDTKNIIIPNKCLIKNLTIVLSVFLVVDPSDGSNNPAIIDIRVVPNLSLNNSETKSALSECVKYPRNSMPPKCAFLTTDYSSRLSSKDDPRSCNCNVTGSVDYNCNKYGGQCNCLPNVVGRQCNQCKPNTYGFDARGCKDCGCEPNGSLNLQCSPDTGKCLCRFGVEGHHCKVCKAGFWQFPDCVPCRCNGLSDVCNKVTGQCINCRGNSLGFNCHQCSIGYFGDPRRSIPCVQCNCPGLSLNLNHSHKCSLISNTINYFCDCKSGYKGQFCDECDDNYYGRPREKNGECAQCICSYNIDPKIPGSCDVRTGECKKCLYHTAGPKCEKCTPGYYGNGVSRTCKNCVCHRLGSNTTSSEVCNHVTGQCPCLPNVIGQQCDQCKTDFFNINSGKGCEPCQCDSRNGAINETCNHLTGQCHCRQSRGGRQCDKCQDGYWGNPRLQDGCQACLCNNNGSLFNQCDRNNGACRCKPGITGKYCDKCARGTGGEMPNCIPCGDCWTQWDQNIEQLFVSLNQFLKNTTDNPMIPGLPSDILEKINKIDFIMKNVPADMESKFKTMRQDLSTLKNQLESFVMINFNGTDYLNLSKSLADLNDKVAMNKIKDFGGAYNIIERSLVSIIKSVNETRASLKSMAKIKAIARQQNDTMNELNLEKLENKTLQLFNLENTFTRNLNRFNQMTCHSMSDTNYPSCPEFCGAVGCQPNNCSREVSVNSRCFKNDSPKFFNEYAWKIKSRKNLDIRFENGLKKNDITRTITEVENAQLLVNITNHEINTRFNQALYLLVKLNTTVNNSVSEHNFKKFLDAINNFSLTKHSVEIRQIEREIKIKIQQLDQKANDVMDKSNLTRTECDSLKKMALETKENATNLLKSIKDLEDNNNKIQKIQSETMNVIQNMDDIKSQMKTELIQAQTLENDTESNQSVVEKLVLVLKTLKEDIEKSLKTIKNDLYLLEMDQKKMKTKLENITQRTQTIIQRKNALIDDINRVKTKSDDNRSKLMEKIENLNKQIVKTREKVANARNSLTKRHLEVQGLNQKVEDRLHYISSLEEQINLKSEFQNSCLP